MSNGDEAVSGGFLRGAFYALLLGGIGFSAASMMNPLADGPMANMPPLPTASNTPSGTDVAATEAPEPVPSDLNPEGALLVPSTADDGPAPQIQAPAIDLGGNDSSAGLALPQPSTGSSGPVRPPSPGSAPVLGGGGSLAGPLNDTGPSVNTQSTGAPQVDDGTGDAEVTEAPATIEVPDSAADDEGTPREPLIIIEDAPTEEAPQVADTDGDAPIETASVDAPTTGESTPDPLPAGDDFVEALDPAPVPEGSALADNAISFERNGNTPVMAIVLQDVGTGGAPREGLVSLSAPVTYAVPVNMKDAAGVASMYQTNGFEVVAMLPELGEQVIERGSDPDALEANLGAFLSAVPNAVAIADRVGGELPKDANLTSVLLNGLQTSGHALLTHPGNGFSTIEKDATEQGVSQATIFRVIDERPEAGNIRIALDRALLEAGKTGKVIVVGRTTPETITTLFTWLLSNGSNAVTIAPVSAVLDQP